MSVTDACGLSIADTVIITEPLVLSTTVSSTSASCNGLGDGTATVTPSGGTAPYNYLWNVSQQTATAIGFQIAQLFPAIVPAIIRKTHGSPIEV